MLRSLSVLTLATTLAAQVQTTAYVQESTLGNQGNAGPLGCSATGLFAEARSQILIPARYLPGPGAVLLGLEALGTSGAGTNTTLTYASLRIAVSRTSATTLGSSFASNLPLPEVLLSTSNLTVHWQANAFTPITFATNYVHDGQSNLVIDIQKVVSPIGDATMKTIQNARRTDLPRMINALGTAGSNAHVANTATVTNNAPLTLALRWAGVGGAFTPTLKLKSDPSASFRAQFEIGRPVDATVQGTPGAVFIPFLGTTLFPTPVLMPGVAGGLWISDPLVLGAGILPAGGASTLNLTIPNDPALVNLYLAFQSVVAPLPITQLQLTNAADFIVTNGL